MGKTSLEYALEDYFIELFRTDPRLKGKQIVHSDRDGKAELNGIVVEATTGDLEADGVAGNRAEVVATWRGGSHSTAARNDLIALAMIEAVQAANTRVTTAQQKFGYFLILNEEANTERPDTKNSRKRILKIPVIAKLR